MSGGTPVDVTLDGEVAVVTINSPLVNALSERVRRGLADALAQALADPQAKAIVLICAGRTFITGADINELGGPLLGPSHGEVFTQIEAGSKPVIAAIHGSALGGGLEAALICHYRIAVPSARMGLPEVNLGILPGGGGTQRLPRIVGMPTALDLITTGRMIGSDEALAVGLIDIVAREDALREDALAFARDILAENRPLRRVRDSDDRLAEARGRPQNFADYRQNHPSLFKGFKSPAAILEALQAAIDLPFDEGIAREQELLEELMLSREAAAQQYMFFARRKAAKRAQAGDGLIAERVMHGMAPAVTALMSAGVSREDIDRVMLDFGFPTGPFAMPHLYGLDGFGDGASHLHGKRQAEQGVNDHTILESLLFPVVNACARLLEEGGAQEASDIDVAATQELGWPVWTGGPTFWAATIGVASVVAGLNQLRARYGDAFRPELSLIRLTQQGKTFQD